MVRNWQGPCSAFKKSRKDGLMMVRCWIDDRLKRVIRALKGNGGISEKYFFCNCPKILFFKGVRSSIDSGDVTETPGDPPTPGRPVSDGSPFDSEYVPYWL